MSKILIKNIKGLVQYGENLPIARIGKEMEELPILENAYLAIEDNIIVAYGLMEEWEGITDWRNVEVIDAEGKYVLPGFCDSHTHTVFAKTREEEFVLVFHVLISIFLRMGFEKLRIEKSSNLMDDDNNVYIKK